MTKLYGYLLVGGLLLANTMCFANTGPNTSDVTISNSTGEEIEIKVEPAEGQEKFEAPVVKIAAGAEHKITVNQKDIKDNKTFSIIGTPVKVSVPSLNNRCTNLFVGNDKSTTYNVVFTKTALGGLLCSSHETK